MVLKWKNDFPAFFENVLGRDIFDKMNVASEGNTLPAVNIRETEKEFMIDLVAPGMKKEDFKISLDNQLLTIASDCKADDDESYVRREFCYQAFKRSFTIPESVDQENVKAKYENGLLTVIIPKKEKEVTKRAIDVS